MPWFRIILIAVILFVYFFGRPFYKVFTIAIKGKKPEDDSVRHLVDMHYYYRSRDLWSQFSGSVLLLLSILGLGAIPISFYLIALLADVLAAYEPSLQNTGATGSLQFLFFYTDGVHQKAVWWAQVVLLSQAVVIYMSLVVREWVIDRKGFWIGLVKFCIALIVLATVCTQCAPGIYIFFYSDYDAGRAFQLGEVYHALIFLFLTLIFAAGVMHKHIRTFVALVWFYLDRVLLWIPMNFWIWLFSLGETKYVFPAEVEDDGDGEAHNPEPQPHPPQPEDNPDGGGQNADDEEDDLDLGDPDDEENTAPTPGWQSPAKGPPPPEHGLE